MNVLNAMRTFVRIVDEGSLVAAAEASGLSPTMVGNHLRSLEERAGMTLLTRTTRRQSLTEFGRLYYERCVEILGLVEDTDALALQSQVEPRGRLRVSSPYSYGVDWLMPALADYAMQYPQIDIDLVLDEREVDLVEDEFEAAIRIGAFTDEDLVARLLTSFRSTLCAAPRYIAAHGEPRQPSDLAQHDCLFYTYGTTRDVHAVYHRRWALAGPEGVIETPVSGRFHVNSSVALRRAALTGLGIAMLPESVIADDLESDALKAVLADYAPQSRPVYLVYRRDRRISPKLRCFINFMIERYSDDGARNELKSSIPRGLPRAP